MPKDLQEAVALIENLTNYERMSHGCIRYNTTNFNLQAFREWLADLGHPEFAPAVVFHVVGTKGKGSVSTMIANGLQQAGICAGLFTSPHLTRLTERIRVDLQEIDDASFCRWTGNLIKDLSCRRSASTDEIVGMRTMFELLTAMGFVYFRERQCSAAVIEAGLGGRLDATNVFLSPNQKLINLIMPIGPEHRGILGRTVEEIAAEKAAVIQPHSHCVILAKQDSLYESAVRNAIAERMSFIDSKATVIDIGNMVPPRRKDASGVQWTITFDDEIFTIKNRLVGEHQAWNVLTALTALMQAYPNIYGERAAVAMSQSDWPGRFECLASLPVPVVIDCAHCVLSTMSMAQAWKQCYPVEKPIVVCGFMADKEIASIAEIVLRELHPQKLIVCSTQNPRSATVEDIEKIFRQQDSTLLTQTCETVEDAVCAALDTGCPVLIFGSVMMVEPARSAWMAWRKKHE
ncbi:MAG: Mur ligase family protein [Candidatus Sumerlaeales bacterium]|nr:Mur ligase family protein [Candidatus Sumerlaeales bacterium]